jgi:hypothetical protein
MTLSLHSKPVRAGLEEFFGNAIKPGFPRAVTQLNENYRTNPLALQAMNLAGFARRNARAGLLNRKLPNEPHQRCNQRT